MANSKVVGKLLIDIEARTSKMEENLAAATAKLDKFNNSTRAAIKGMTGFDIGNLGKSFLKFTLLLDGVRSVLNSVANSVKDIWANADALGRAGIISPQAAASIEDAQIALSKAFNTTKGWAAEAFSFILDAGKAVAIRAQNIAATITQGASGAGALFGRVEFYKDPELKATTDDDRAKARDTVAFYAEIDRLLVERGRLMRELQSADSVGVAKARELAEQVERLNTAKEAAAKAGSSVKAAGFENDALKASVDLTRILAAEEKQANELKRQWAVSAAKTDKMALPDNERLAELYRVQAKLMADKAAVARMVQAPGSNRTFQVMTEEDKLALKTLIDANNQINAILERRRTQMERLREVEVATADVVTERGQMELTTRERLALVDSKILLLRERYAKAMTGAGADPERALELGQDILEQEKTKNELLKTQRALYLEVGQTIAQTTVDSILQLNKLTDVLKNVAAAIAQMVIQKMIVNQLASVIGGGLGLLSGGATSAATSSSQLAAWGSEASVRIPGKAVGGPVMAGRTYLVGEQGQELFTPNTSGSITTNGDLRASQARPSGESGLVYAPVYNITSGVTANELRPILRQHAEQVRGSIAMDLARGGRRAAQFGG